MRRVIIAGIVLVLVLFLLPSCAAGISSEEYAKASADLAVAQSQIKDLQSQLEVATEKLEAGRARLEIMHEMIVAHPEVERAQALAYFLKWRDHIVAIGDPVLIDKFDRFIKLVAEEPINEEAVIEALEALEELYGYLLESTIKVLE